MPNTPFIITLEAQTLLSLILQFFLTQPLHFSQRFGVSIMGDRTWAASSGEVGVGVRMGLGMVGYTFCGVWGRIRVRGISGGFRVWVKRWMGFSGRIKAQFVFSFNG